MELIFTDFCPFDTPYKNLHSHVGDNVINWLKGVEAPLWEILDPPLFNTKSNVIFKTKENNSQSILEYYFERKEVGKTYFHAQMSGN